MLRLYDYLESGNAYKVRLMLSLLGIPFEQYSHEPCIAVVRHWHSANVVDENRDQRTR